jgi:DNA-binding transcriptional ArsR family regulator
MVEDTTLDDVFVALAHPARRAIIGRLAQSGEATVTEIAGPFEMSLNGVSKHLKILERAGLIRREVFGREHWCVLEAAPLGEAAAWMSRYRRFWEASLDSLERYLEARRSAQKTEGK